MTLPRFYPLGSSNRKRIAFAQAAVTAMALLTGWQAAAQTSSSRLQLESQRVRLTIPESVHGAISSLVDKATGRELTARKSRPLLFRIEFSESGAPNAARFALTNWDAASVRCENTGDGTSAGRVTFAKFGQRPIQVQCMFRTSASDPNVRCRIQVAFPKPLVLESVQFPMVTLQTATAGQPDDFVVLGATKGGLHRRPSPGQEFAATQPGSLAAQFGCWYDRQVGLFLAALDRRGYRKKLVFSCDKEGLDASWVIPTFASQVYKQQFDVVLTTFHGAEDAAPNWRDAADLYKQWAVQQPWCERTLTARDDLPDWMKQGPAMVRFGRNWLRDPDAVKTWLQDYWKRHYPKLPPLLIAYWGWEKLGNWATPDYFPCYPSDETMRELSAFGRALGGHTFLWPSGYRYARTYKKRPDGTFTWDDRAQFDKNIRPHAVHDRNGYVHLWTPTWMLGGESTGLCPGDSWTFDWFNRIAVELARRGAELIQVDQVVGGDFSDCYDHKHGHTVGPGPWETDVFRKQLKTMLAECRKIQPDAVVCFEEPNEWYIQEIGVQDYRDWEVLNQPGIELASVFNYLYHEYVSVFQSNPQANNRLQAAWCLADGQIPHIVPSPVQQWLLRGGDFENASNAIPYGWEKVAGFQGQRYACEVACDAAERHKGRSSLRMSNTKADDFGQVAQNILLGKSFAVGRTYQLSVWMKTAGLQQPNVIAISALSSPLKGHGSWQIPMPKASAGWTRGQVRFTLPAGAEFVRIMLNLRGSGTVWLDDMNLEEVRGDGSLAGVQPAPPLDHEFMLAWVRLFHGPGRPYLFLGRMLHPPRLECEQQEALGHRMPAMFHNAFAAPDGSQAVVVVNATAASQTGRLTWQGRAQEIHLAPWEAKLIEGGK